MLMLTPTTFYPETVREEKTRADGNGDTSSSPTASQDDDKNNFGPCFPFPPPLPFLPFASSSHKPQIPNPPLMQGLPPSESVRDRKTIQRDGARSPELRALTNRFLAYHGASYVCNMATIAASVVYALCVAARGL